MTDIVRKTPIYFWIIAVLSLLWNMGGISDYVQSQFNNPDYFAAAAEQLNVPVEEVIAYAKGWPAWFDALWACGVWGALLGSVALLFRTRFAVHLFGLSLFGLATTTAYRASVPAPEWTYSTFNTVFMIAIWSAAVFLLIFAISMRKKGILR